MTEKRYNFPSRLTEGISRPDRFIMMVEAARRAASGGLENWQANLKIDEEGVELLKYFKLQLF